tara:strand:- start:54 stop:167 length:114 start_codon:yes stop_codon:yes gene_type:complete
MKKIWQKINKYIAKQTDQNIAFGLTAFVVIIIILAIL